VKFERFGQHLPVWNSGRRAAAPASCFADEIVDFPSVNDLVSRARHAFLGEDAGDATLTTEVSLSSHEATRGTVLPLDVPVRGTCARCGGRGEVWTEPCLACYGSGDQFMRHPIRVTVPPGVADGARLRFRVRAPQAEPVRVEVRVAVRSSAA
jgi:hypothetical protein